MDTALVDLGSVSVAPSYARAMRGYIALSRVRKVDDLLLAQPFSPALFQQGQQPWAALLLDTLKGAVKWPEDVPVQGSREMCEEVELAVECSKKLKLLKDLCWTCDACP